MKFIVIVIDEDYTSLKSENKQTKVKTNEHKITEKSENMKRTLLQTVNVIGHTRLPSVTSLSVERHTNTGTQHTNTLSMSKQQTKQKSNGAYDPL